jgi:hypothetical protein
MDLRVTKVIVTIIVIINFYLKLSFTVSLL